MDGRKIFSIFILIFFFLSSCNNISSYLNNIGNCNCCVEGLLELDPIQDLIDGDTYWMGLEVGKTKKDDILPHFSNEKISYCISSQSEEICNSNPEKILIKSWGVIKLTLLDFSCEDFWINWEGDEITSIDFRCDDCIAVDSILNKINASPYISSIFTGLHEVDIVSTLIYPTYGLSVGTKTMDRYQAEINANTTITYISLNPPQSELIISSVGDFINEYKINCARPWVGYGNLFELYYPEDTGKGCPFMFD